MDTARLWMIRTNDPDFEKWDALADWLEEDSRHLDAYEAALAEDAWAANLAAVANHPAIFAQGQVRRAGNTAKRSWLAVGGAVAAALIAVGTWSVLERAGGGTEIATAPGERRSLALADGTRVDLNSDTRLRYDRDKPRSIMLEQGEAVFEVRHDAAKPFVVAVGDTRLIDAGTVFNVVRDDGSLRVAVAEGAVIYEAREEPIRLEAGEALVRSRSASKPELRRINTAEVGSWRNGILSYDNADISLIADDLARAVGKPVLVSDSVKGQRFSGTLAVNGPVPDLLSRLGPLLGVTFRESGEGWEMIPADGAMR